MADATDPAAFPFTFACRRSGNCCAVPGGFVRVDDADVAAIAAHLGLSVAAARSRFVAASGDRLRDGLGTRCVFLTEGREGAACQVYPVRPARCRSWPFWPELLESAEAMAAAMRRCPGIRPR
jgi:Fe-S-cluster containining protein